MTPAASPDHAAHSLTPRQANYALGVFLAAYVLSFIDRQILSLMVDPIRADLGLSDLQIGLLQGLAFALLYAVLGIPFGMMADRGSRKWIICCGIVGWSVATGLCGLASSFTLLFAARMMVGVGEATLSPAAHSFLSDAFTGPRLARAMAIYTLGITIGAGGALMLGGSVVGLIASAQGIQWPLLGALSAWQMAFIIVALPGIPIALLAALLREPARTRSDGQRHQGAPLGETLAYLVRHRRAFLPLYLSSSLLSIMGYGMIGWYPSLLIRGHGLTAADAGLWLGAVYLVAGSAGTIFGGVMAERLALRGRADANLRVVLWLTAAVLLPAVAAPLMPSALGVIMVFTPACFFFNGYFGCSVAAIQLTSPSSMRGTNAALFLLANSLVGLSLGSVVIPLADRHLFAGDGTLGGALSLVAALCCLTTLLVARLGLAAYAERVRAVAAGRP